MDKSRIVISVISIILIIFAIGLLVFWQFENNESANLTNDIYNSTMIVEIPNDAENIEIVSQPSDNINNPDNYDNIIDTNLISVDLDNLISQNSDTIAWIKVDGTDISYPVVQTTDNDYYLNHSFNGKYNSSGWIFADYRNDINNFNKNTIIYGHNRLNNTMFATLNTVLSEEWFDNRDWCIQFSTLTHNTLWQIFSVYKIPSETYYITTDFEDELEYMQFLETILDRSYYDFETNLNFNDKILTLSTCTNVNNGRLVVHAKLIKSQVK